MDNFKTKKYLDPETFAFFETCLETSRYLFLVVLDRTFVIKNYNRGFADLFAEHRGLETLFLGDILLPESRQLLNPELMSQEMPVRLHFSAQDNRALSCDCHFGQFGDEYLLFSDHALLADNDVLQKLTTINNEMIALTRELNRKNRALLEAREQIKTLSGIIPICMHCKGIRDDQGYWSNLESFLMKHSEAQFSHGICPECMKKRFPDEPEFQEENNGGRP